MFTNLILLCRALSHQKPYNGMCNQIQISIHYLFTGICHEFHMNSVIGQCIEVCQGDLTDNV